MKKRLVAIIITLAALVAVVATCSSYDSAEDAEFRCQDAWIVSDLTCDGKCPDGMSEHQGVCCAPDCKDKGCGDDGCGGICGMCECGERCLPDGVCVPGDPCEGNECGSDNCGGSCGSCAEYSNSYCTDMGQCGCDPSCEGKQCGDDKCGGVCGTCEPGWLCGNEQQCYDHCAGIECGDDGYGGSCGSCIEHPNSYCTPLGQCDCSNPTCHGKQCGDDGCGGDCGECESGLQCGDDHQCFNACVGKECGDDGYGGSCGGCEEGWKCNENHLCEWGEAGTWLDPDSGLVWQVTPTWEKMPWDEAKSHCSNLTMAGHTDWRLPGIGELRSLIRGCPTTELEGSCDVEEGDCLAFSCRNKSCGGCIWEVGPADGCYWPDNLQGTCAWYWSSSATVGSDDYYAWAIRFPYATVHMYVVYHDAYVRCVR